MKAWLLILSLILSLFGRGRTKEVSEALVQDTGCAVGEAPSPEKSTDFSPSRDICLTSAQGYSFTGNDSTNSISARNLNSGRRTSPQKKSTSRMVKSGKVIYNDNLHPFLTPSFFTLSGAHNSERYLFSICRLRL